MAPVLNGLKALQPVPSHEQISARSLTRFIRMAGRPMGKTSRTGFAPKKRCLARGSTNDELCCLQRSNEGSRVGEQRIRCGSLGAVLPGKYRNRENAVDMERAKSALDEHVSSCQFQVLASDALFPELVLI
jgi:hypothetical protein